MTIDINQNDSLNYVKQTSLETKATPTKNIETNKKEHLNNLENSPQNDELILSKEIEKPNNISRIRLATCFLTDAQVEEINKTGKLPDNAKFVPDGVGGYSLSNNFLSLRGGTQQIPEGFEIKKNVFGQAVVLPKGFEEILIRKN